MNLRTNLYDNKLYFGITFNRKRTLILEPDKWDTISNHVPRDQTYFGFTSDFLEDKYGMLFTFAEDSTNGLNGGAQLLKDIYENHGPDSEVYFEVGYWMHNSFRQIKSWRINLQDYDCDFGGVSTTIEKMPLQALFRSRQSAPCTINDYANMNGDLLGNISPWRLRLHSKTLEEITVGSSSQQQETNTYQDNGHNSFVVFIQPDQSNLNPNELSTVYNQPVGLINTGIFTPPTAYLASIFTDGVNQFTPQFSGFCNIKWSGEFVWWAYQGRWEMGIVGGVGSPDDQFCWTVTPRLVIQRMIGGVLTIINSVLGTTQNLDRNSPGFAYPVAPGFGTFPMVSNSVDRVNFNKVPFNWNETFTGVEVQANDNVYVHLWLQPTGVAASSSGVYNGLVMQAENFVNNIRYDQLTSAPPSECDGYRIIDVLNQFVENMTGFPNRVKSPFFEEGGFGYKYMLTNGYALRNFGSNIYKPKKAFQGLINDLQAIFFVGMGFQTINQEDFIVIDAVPKFFQNKVLGIYGDTFEWKDKHNPKVCYNKADIGYNKFEGLNLIQQDEFNTKGSYLTQFIKINDQTLNKMSDIIAAGYLIEEQRRNQFITNPGQSLTNDNDWFIIATAEPNIFKSQNPSFVNPIGVNNPIIGFQQPMFLLLGDSVNISFGGAIGDMNFAIANQVSGYPISSGAIRDKYTIFTEGTWSAGSWGRNAICYDNTSTLWYLCYNAVTSSTPPHLDIANWILWSGLSSFSGIDIEIVPPSPNQIFAERNQPFEICSGVIDPSTIYNGRLSLGHILENWRPLLGVGLSSVDLNSNDYSVTQIIPTLIRMNSLFTTKFLSTEPNKGNVGDLTIVENARLFIRNYLKNGENLFSHTGATCKLRLGWDERNLICQALCGETGDDNINFGGIVLQDDFNVYWFCHIMDMQYDPYKEIATFEVQKVRKFSPFEFEVEKITSEALSDSLG
jgi:hypothetical protein